MHRRLIVTSAIALVLTAIFLTGSGVGSSAVVSRDTQKLPVGLAAAIHARLGAGATRSSSAALASLDTYLGVAIAVSADGTTALVGAPGVAGEKGAAYIFHASDAGSWSSTGTPVATLTKKNGAAHPLFGLGVALSADGTTAFVSAPLAYTSFGDGAIYVFHASAEDAWTSSSAPTATLTVTSTGYGLGINLAASPDGTTLVASGDPYNGTHGAAFVFHAPTEGAWASTSTPTAMLRNAGQSGNDFGAGFAVAISADGTTVLVSDDRNPNGGGAYIFHASAEDAWASSSTPTAILSDSNSAEDDHLGWSVALSGDGTLALLGAPGANSNAGAADVFHSSGEAAWTSTSTPTATLTAAGDEFGVDVAMSTDGTTGLVTAPGVAASRGAAYIFHVSGEGAWASTSTPNAALTKAGAHVHDSLAIGVLSPDGATALVGATGVRSGTGAVYVFHASDASSWATSSTPNATLTNAKLAACVVPKLRGLKLPAAKAALFVGRCRLGRVTKVHSAHRKGRVLSQNRKAGRRLGIGAKVGVRVGR